MRLGRVAARGRRPLSRTSRSSCAASRRSAARACSARGSRRWAGSCARSRARTSSSRARPGRGRRGPGARLITYLIARGKRVAIASQSHKAIHKLLSEIEADALETGVALRGLKKASRREPRLVLPRAAGSSRTPRTPATSTTPTTTSSPAPPGSSRARSSTGKLDYLFVDEAGQISLADALALGTCAKTIVLLGDPVQLAQVTQGVHPGDAGRSVLEAPARRPPDRGRGHGPLPRALVPHAPGRLPVHLRRVLRGAARTRPTRARAQGELVRDRDPLAAGRAPRELDLVGGGGDADPRRDRAAAHGDVDGLEGRRAADHSERRHGRRAVQRAGEASPGAAPGRRRGRHRRQVPGSGGAGRLLLDGVLVGRRRAARDRLPHVAEPPERRRLARAVPRLPRVRARAPRRRRAGRSSTCGSRTRSAASSSSLHERRSGPHSPSATGSAERKTDPVALLAESAIKRLCVLACPSPGLRASQSQRPVSTASSAAPQTGHGPSTYSGPVKGPRTGANATVPSHPTRLPPHAAHAGGSALRSCGSTQTVVKDSTANADHLCRVGQVIGHASRDLEPRPTTRAVDLPHAPRHQRFPASTPSSPPGSASTDYRRPTSLWFTGDPEERRLSDE